MELIAQSLQFDRLSNFFAKIFSSSFANRFLPRIPVYANGVYLEVDRHSLFGKTLLERGDYEPELTSVLCRLLETEDQFIDMGAHEGYFSLLAAKQVGPMGTVLSVEPQERLWKRLRRNYKINHLKCCHLIRAGVGSEKKGNLYLAPLYNSGASTLVKPTKAFRHQVTSIPLISLDRIVAICSKPRIKLIKMDIEGYETHALQSGVNALKSGRIENILIEIHPEALNRQGNSPKEISMFLKGFGYHCFYIGQQYLYSLDPKIEERIRSRFLPQFPLLDLPHSRWEYSESD